MRSAVKTTPIAPQDWLRGLLPSTNARPGRVHGATSPRLLGAARLVLLERPVSIPGRISRAAKPAD
jgi:hypothetical protein